MELRALQRLREPVPATAFVAAELDAMRFEPQHAFLAHQVGLAPQPVDQRAERARADLIWQPLAQRLHLEPRRERLGLVMGGDRGHREALELRPFALGGVALLVAERELDGAA